MNINYFFIIISLCLSAILFLFKPQEADKKLDKDIALFNISSFSMYELNQNGLITFMNASDGARFKDKYTISDINYTDNSKEYIANLKAKDGIYEDDILTLIGGVVYTREDGLKFKTEEAIYHKKSSTVTSNSNYIAYMGNNIAYGREIEYNNALKKLKSKDIFIIYHIEDKKR